MLISNKYLEFFHKLIAKQSGMFFKKLSAK